jgi:gliding motility-associated-like protein
MKTKLPDKLTNQQDNRVQIFNRWGNLIFETAGYDNTMNVWDGRTNRGINLGKQAPSGTYFYILELKSINQVKTGYIIIN